MTTRPPTRPVRATTEKPNVVIVEDKKKNQPEQIGVPMLVITANLVICFVILPLLVTGYEQREDLNRFIIVGALAIPALLGVLYLLYRAYWWGMGCLTTLLTIVLIGGFALMALNGITFRAMLNRLIGF